MSTLDSVPGYFGHRLYHLLNVHRIELEVSACLGQCPSGVTQLDANALFHISDDLFRFVDLLRSVDSSKGLLAVDRAF